MKIMIIAYFSIVFNVLLSLSKPSGVTFLATSFFYLLFVETNLFINNNVEYTYMLCF